MKKCILVICLFSSLCCAAQPEDSSRTALRVFIEPLALLDFASSSQPSLRLGVDVPLGTKFSLVATGGLYTGGFYARAGVKRYTRAIRPWMGFVELHAFYKREAHDVHDNLEVYDSTAGHELEGEAFSYHTSRAVYGMHLLVGDRISARHWYLEWYAGAGLRHRNVSISISESMQNRLYHYNESTIDNITNTPADSQLRLSLSAGIRLGYRFWRPKRAINSPG